MEMKTGIRNLVFPNYQKAFSIGGCKPKPPKLAELAKEATTKKSRESLSSQIIELGAAVLSYVNTQKLKEGTFM